MKVTCEIICENVIHSVASNLVQLQELAANHRHAYNSAAPRTCCRIVGHLRLRCCLSCSGREYRRLLRVRLVRKLTLNIALTGRSASACRGSALQNSVDVLPATTPCRMKAGRGGMSSYHIPDDKHHACSYCIA